MKTKIIFIGGIPSSGKTTIARSLALKLKIDKIIDLDILKNTYCTLINKESEPYLWTTSHEAEIIENLSFIDGFNKYCDCIQKYLINCLEFMKKEKYVIVEGAQLTPKIIEKIPKNNFDVIYFNICLKNKEQLINHINKKLKIRQGNWLKNIDKIWEIQNYITNLSKINIYNSNLNKTVKKIIKELKNENIYN